MQNLNVPVPSSIDPADVDNDRDLDIIVADIAGAAQLLMGSGGNSFAAGDTLEIGLGASQVLAEDLNGDGNPELITANTLDGSLSVLVNDPTDPGEFAPAVNIPLDDLPHALVAANLDGAVAVIPGTEPPQPDADQDLAVLIGAGSAARVIVLRNDTAPPPTPNDPQPLALTQDVNEPCALFAVALAEGDNVDGNAGPDLVTITSGGSCFSDGFAPGISEVNVAFNTSVPVNQPNPCPADIAPSPNGDNAVNVQDLLAVIGAWGVCPIAPNPCSADLAPQAGDNIVNVQDLLAVIGAWGACQR